MLAVSRRGDLLALQLRSAAWTSRVLLRGDVLRVGEVDGTWIDYENSGKSYGTAMALSVLAIARVARERVR